MVYDQCFSFNLENLGSLIKLQNVPVMKLPWSGATVYEYYFPIPITCIHYFHHEVGTIDNRLVICWTLIVYWYPFILFVVLTISVGHIHNKNYICTLGSYLIICFCLSFCRFSSSKEGSFLDQMLGHWCWRYFLLLLLFPFSVYLLPRSWWMTFLVIGEYR